MKQTYYKLIKQLDEIIANVEIGKDGRLMQLYKKREKLEDAFNRVKMEN